MKSQIEALVIEIRELKEHARPYPQGDNPILDKLRALLAAIKAYLRCDDVAYCGSVALWLQGSEPTFGDLDVWTNAITEPLGIPGLHVFFQRRAGVEKDIALGQQYITVRHDICALERAYVLGANYVLAEQGRHKPRMCARPDDALLHQLRNTIGIQPTIPRRGNSWLSELEAHLFDFRYARGRRFTQCADEITLLREIQGILKSCLDCKTIAYCGSVALWLQGVAESYGDLDVYTDKIYTQPAIEQCLSLPVSGRASLSWQIGYLDLDVFFSPSEKSKKHLELGLPSVKQLDSGIWVQDAEYILRYNWQFLRHERHKKRPMLGQKK